MSPTTSTMDFQSIDDLFDTNAEVNLDVDEYPGDDSRHSSRTSYGNLPISLDHPSAPGYKLRTITEPENDMLIDYHQIGLIWKNHGFGTVVEWERDPTIESIIEVLKRRIDPGKDYAVKLMWTGTYNKFYSVEFEDKEYVMKLTLPVCPRTKTESEVTTMRWTSANTNLKSLVPEVIDYSSSANNPIGCEWVLMKRLEGVPLSSCWREVELGSKERIVKALAEYARGVYKRQFKQIGNLFPAPLPCRGRRYQVGKISSMRFFWNRGLDIEPESGPFRTTREWTLRRLNIAHEQLRDRFHEIKHWPRDKRQLMWNMFSMSGVLSRLWRLHDVLFPPGEDEDPDGHEIIAIGPSQLLTPAATPTYSHNDYEDSDSGDSGQYTDTDDDMSVSPNETASSAHTIMSVALGARQCNTKHDHLMNMVELQQESAITSTVDQIHDPHSSSSISHRASGLPLGLQSPSKDKGYYSGSQQELYSSQSSCHKDRLDLSNTGPSDFPQPYQYIQDSSVSVFDKSSHDISKLATSHDSQDQLALQSKEWEPIRPKFQDHINTGIDLDPDTESTMLWHDNLSADNILVDPDTGRLTGVLDWDCISCLPVAIACDWPAFLQDGKHRATKPDLAQYSVWISGENDQHQGVIPISNHKSTNEDLKENPQSINYDTRKSRQRHKDRIALQANYWRALRDFELTYLRKVFTQEMSDKCPSWYNTWKQSKVRKDYDAAVQSCDNEYIIHKVEAWCEAVEEALDKGQEIKPPQVMSLHCAIYEGPDWKNQNDLDDLSTELMKPLYEHKRKVAEWQDDLDELHAAKKSLPNVKGLKTKKVREKAAAEKSLIEARIALNKHTEDLAHLEGLDEQGFNAVELAHLRQEATTKAIKAREEIQRAEGRLVTCESRAEVAEAKYETARARELDALERIHDSEWFKKFDRERTFNYQTWKNLEKALYEEYGDKTWWKHRLEPLGYCGRKREPHEAPISPHSPEGEASGDNDTAKFEVQSEISEEE